MSVVNLGAGRHRVIQWSGLRIERAVGAWLEDEAGHKYLDFFGASGVNLIGHSHPAVVSAVSEAFSSCAIGAFPGRFDDALASALGEILEGSSWSVELFSGGAEAVEGALRAAEEFTGRNGVIGFTGGFHGKTTGARSVTAGSAPHVPGVAFAPYPDCAKCPLKLLWPRCDYACANTILEIAHRSKVPVGAIIIEPLQGRSGNILPPEGYLRRIRRIAYELDLLLILDETLTGLGRTGRWLAHYGEDVTADLVIIGKGFGGGYPVSALIGTNKVMSAGSFGKMSGNSSSFGGFATACAAATATIRTLIEEDLINRSDALGSVLKTRLRAELKDCAPIDRITGRGMAVGLHFTGSGASSTNLQKQFFDQCQRRGLINMTGEGCIRLYPPLTIDESDLSLGIDILCEAAWSIAK